MKKILLISDTHSYLDPKLKKYILEADEVWHAGDIGAIDVCRQIEKDKPLRAVYGNIDDPEVRNFYPENLIFNCEDVKVFITHIGNYPGKYPERIKQVIRDQHPKLFICGHSHILKVMFDKENDLLYINPGSCGVQGFHKIKTAVRFEIDDDQIKDLAVIELGNRASIE